MPSKNGNGNGNENIAGALADISDRLTRLVQDEIELAKAEVAQKVASLVRGVVAVAAGAVFGIFAVVFFLLTLAWVLDGIFVSGAGSLWLGFLIVLVILLLLTVGAALFAWRSFSVGAPTPKMAIDEGKKIKTTVTTLGGPAHANGKGDAARAQGYPAQSFAAVAAPAVAVAAVTEPTATPEVEPTRPAPEPRPASELTPDAEPAVELRRSTSTAEPDSATSGPAPESEKLWSAPTPEPSDVQPVSETSNADDEPTFVSVPEEPTAEQPIEPDRPSLLADQTPNTPSGDEPAYEVEQVPEDDDSTGPEN